MKNLFIPYLLLLTGMVFILVSAFAFYAVYYYLCDMQMSNGIYFGLAIVSGLICIGVGVLFMYMAFDMAIKD